MWEPIEQKRLLIKDFGPKGRGIVAAEDIKPGELIERSPVIIIPPGDRAKTDATVLFTYVFMWEKGTTEEDLYQHEGRAAVALGHTSLINHSYRPNCRFVRRIDELILDLVAARDIKCGEELTIDYQMTLWSAYEE